MALTTRRTESGLVLAEHSMDEAAVSRALKEIDDRYVLQKRERDETRFDRSRSVLVYKVVCLVNHEYAPVIWTWMDEHGNPLPLSSGLVEAVKQARLDARNKGIDAEEFNRRREEAVQRDLYEQGMEIVREHAPRLAGRVQVSLAHRNRKQQWQKANQGRLTR